MIAWVIVRADDPYRPRLTIDDVEVRVELRFASLVWPAAPRDLTLIQRGFVPALTRRVWSAIKAVRA